MSSKFINSKSLPLSMLLIATITPLVVASSPGYTQTPSLAESAATLTPVSPQDLPAQATSAQRACRPIARVVSEPMPQPGQTSRSSNNFDLNSIRVGETVRVSVVQNGKLNSRIHFNIKRDIRLRPDPLVARNVHTGFLKRVSNYPLYPVYIADPSGAGRSSFKVTFCK